MFNKSFHPNELKKFILINDLRKFRKNIDGILNDLEAEYSKILNDTFQWNLIKRRKHWEVSGLAQKIILRKLNYELKKVYKVKQNNRESIVRQLSIIFKEDPNIHVLRTDIKGFYESIPSEILLVKLKTEMLISPISVDLIYQLFDNYYNILMQKIGVPRGINLSSTLSEIYMRNFDTELKYNQDIYYYSRYVDDIIILSHNLYNLNDIRRLFNKNQLLVNWKKTKTYIINETSLPLNIDFLGYKFIITNFGTKTKSGSKIKKQVNISIAKKKIQKIKTRIVKSFLDYLKNPDYQLLHYRIKFLSGNYIIRKHKVFGSLKAGLYYNYKLIDPGDVVLDELTIFYRKLLCSKQTSIGRQINSKISGPQKNQLYKYNFKEAFNKRILYKMKSFPAKKVKSCWL